MSEATAETIKEKALEKPLKNGTFTGKDPKNGRFLPGNELSTGKPKGTKHFSTLFKEIFSKESIQIKDKDGKIVSIAYDKAMALAIARKAIKGSVHAFDSIANRVDGLPTQAIEMEVSTPPVPIYNGKSIKKKTGQMP